MKDKMVMLVFVRRIITKVEVIAMVVVMVPIGKTKLYRWRLATCNVMVVKVNASTIATISSSNHSAQVAITNETLPMVIIKVNNLINNLLTRACTVVVTIGTKTVVSGSNNPLGSTIILSNNLISCRLPRLMCQRRLHIPTAHIAHKASNIFAIRILVFDGLN